MGIGNLITLPLLLLSKMLVHPNMASSFTWTEEVSFFFDFISVRFSFFSVLLDFSLVTQLGFQLNSSSVN